MWQFLSTSSADSVWAPTVLFNFKVDKTSFVAFLNDVLHHNLKLYSNLVPYTPIHRQIGRKLASTVVTVTTVDPQFLWNFAVNKEPNRKTISDYYAERRLGQPQSWFCPL